MLLIVCATGAAAFLFSFLLLKAGLTIMYARYPLAIGLAYLVFLVLLRLWLNYESSATAADAFDVGDGFTQIPDAVASSLERGADSGGATAGDAAAGAFDLDELLFVIIAVAALAAGLLVCLYVVWSAPALLAEVLVDGVVMSRIYKKLKVGGQSYWVFGALRRTWIPAVLVALFFALAGFAMQRIEPNARSIGQVISYVTGKLL